jgi:putative DNA primase/helicase
MSSSHVFKMLPLCSSIANEAFQFWKDAKPAENVSDHFYLQAFGIDPASTDFRISDAGQLLIPMSSTLSAHCVDVMQISPDGTKSPLMVPSLKEYRYSTIEGTAGASRVFCVDLSDGWTIWKATGRTVIICWNNENMQAVAHCLPALPADCLAVNNDNAETAGHNFRFDRERYGHNHRAAMEVGRPFYLAPQPGKSFASLGIHATQEVFLKPPVSSVPIFATTELETIVLEKPGRQEWLVKLSQQIDPLFAATLASSIAAGNVRKVPVEMSMQELRQILEGALVQPTIHPNTFDKIFEQLHIRQEMRRDNALRPVRIPKCARKRHDFEYHPHGLPILKNHEWKGCIMIQGPMASGKTQLVGLPFASWAQSAKMTFIAICHRVTLTVELAQRLRLPLYNTKSVDDRSVPERMSICLPSITSRKHLELVDKADMIFIDEVSQVLRFLEAEECCKTGSANSEGVYEKLKKLVSNAKCVVVADAGMDSRVLGFLELCRPNERFRIIYVPEPDNAGIDATYFYDRNAISHITACGIAELQNNGKIWIAVEAKKDVFILERFFSDAGYSTLAIHADNKTRKRQKKFIANADSESLQFDVVIASPAISSGLSIEHTGIAAEKRFTLGLYLGGGFATTPADASQQLRRVRYLKRFVLGLRPNPFAGGLSQHADAYLNGAQQASLLEGSDKEVGSFDRFVAEIRTSTLNARADFCAGLLWKLDADGWALTRAAGSSCLGVEDALKNAEVAVTHDRIEAFMTAPIIDDKAALELERAQCRTEPQNIILGAHRVRECLGLRGRPLSKEALLFWDDGRCIAQLDYFDAFRGVVPARRDSRNSIVSQHYHVARAKALAKLFEGVDLINMGITRHTADIILTRVLKNRHLLAFLSVVSARFLEWTVDKYGEVQPMKKPPEDSIKIATQILASMNLQTYSRLIRVSEARWSDIEPSTAGQTISLKSKPKKGNAQHRFYTITPDSYYNMCAWSDSRNQMRETKKIIDHQLIR